jgi:prevent-host-death family protein
MPKAPRGTSAPAGGVLKAAEFKASALAVMRRVRDSGVGVTVTSHGRPLVRIVPVRDGAEPTGHGCMRDTCELLVSEGFAFPPRAAHRGAPREPRGKREP